MRKGRLIVIGCAALLFGSGSVLSASACFSDAAFVSLQLADSEDLGQDDEAKDDEPSFNDSESPGQDDAANDAVEDSEPPESDATVEPPGVRMLHQSCVSTPGADAGDRCSPGYVCVPNASSRALPPNGICVPSCTEVADCPAIGVEWRCISLTGQDAGKQCAASCDPLDAGVCEPDGMCVFDDFLVLPGMTGSSTTRCVRTTEDAAPPVGPFPYGCPPGWTAGLRNGSFPTCCQICERIEPDSGCYGFGPPLTIGSTEYGTYNQKCVVRYPNGI